MARGKETATAAAAAAAKTTIFTSVEM